jgi:hypothetical protein
LKRTGNGVRRGEDDNLFLQRADAAIQRAIDHTTAAIAFFEKHPEIATAPPLPPPSTPDFLLPEGLRGAFPGREVTLNALRGDFETLNKMGGGDLGGSRAKIHAEIATAAREVIADILHERQARDFSTLRGTLQRARNNIQRISDANNSYLQRADAAVSQAIVDVAAALVFITDHPSAAPAPPTVKPDFQPGVSARPGREIPLNLLKTAFDQLAGIPGGDLGGQRTKIQNGIVTAANEILAEIRETARQEREAAAARGRGTPGEGR